MNKDISPREFFALLLAILGIALSVVSTTIALAGLLYLTYRGLEYHVAAMRTDTSAIVGVIVWLFFVEILILVGLPKR